MRRQSQPYIPPHRRKLSLTPDQLVPRSLDDLPSGHIQVLVTLDDGFDWSTCPFAAAEVTTAVKGATRCITLPDGDDHLAEDLLLFFVTSSNALEQPARDRCRIVLRSSLSKERRKAWHRLSTSLGLQSQSQGIGEHRQLHIGVSNSLGPRGSSVSAAAKKLWAAQEVGGELAQLSLNEIQGMMDTNAMSMPLQELSAQIEKAAALQNALMCKDADAANLLLFDDPRLVWLRMPESEYPLITAMRQGLQPVVEHIVLYGGANVLQQRTRKYQTISDLVSQQKDAETRQRLTQALEQRTA